MDEVYALLGNSSTGIPKLVLYAQVILMHLGLLLKGNVIVILTFNGLNRRCNVSLAQLMDANPSLQSIEANRNQKLNILDKTVKFPTINIRESGKTLSITTIKIEIMDTKIMDKLTSTTNNHNPKPELNQLNKEMEPKLSLKDSSTETWGMTLLDITDTQLLSISFNIETTFIKLNYWNKEFLTLWENDK